MLKKICLLDLDQKLRYQENLDIEALLTVIKNLTEIYFPKVKQSRKQCKVSKNPWITKGILASIKHQNKLFRKFLKTKTEESHKACRNKLTRIKKMAKASYSKILLKTCGSTESWKLS